MKQIKIGQLQICVGLVVIMFLIRIFQPKGPYSQNIVYISNYIISSIILSMWLISIYRRIIHKKIRLYLFIIGCLLLYWVFTRTMRYTVFYGNIEDMRKVWYSYYVAIVFAPLFGHYIAITIEKNDDFSLPLSSKVLIIIALALVISVLTNNSHKLMFVITRYDLTTRVYKYGVLYYIITLWVFTLMSSSLYLLFKKCRLNSKENRIILPFTVIVVGIIYVIFFNLNKNHIAVKLVDLNTAFVFLYMSFWESCIYSGLIQSNRMYRDFFTNSALDTVIYDDVGNAVYSSKEENIIDKKTFDELVLKHTFIIRDDKQININKIKGGYVIWHEELSEVIRMLSNLSQVNEELKNEITIMQTQMEVESRKLQYKERLRIFDLISIHTNKQIKEIKKCILAIKNGSTDINYWKKISLMAIYIKRSSNIILMSQGKDKTANKDFEFYFYETVNNLKKLGIHCNINNAISKPTNFDTVLKIYEIIEIFLESTFLYLDQLYIILSNEDEKYKIIFMSDSPNIQDVIDKDYFKSYIYFLDTEDSFNMTVLLSEEVEK